MTTRDQLLKLMAEHNLDDARCAVLVGMSASAVQSWRLGRREMPAPILELLTLKLKAGYSGMEE